MRENETPARPAVSEGRRPERPMPRHWPVSPQARVWVSGSRLHGLERNVVVGDAGIEAGVLLRRSGAGRSLLLGATGHRYRRCGTEFLGWAAAAGFRVAAAAEEDHFFGHHFGDVFLYSILIVVAAIA